MYAHTLRPVLMSAEDGRGGRIFHTAPTGTLVHVRAIKDDGRCVLRLTDRPQFQQNSYVSQVVPA